MPKHLHRYLLPLVDWLLPPRHSDLLVRSLSHEILAQKTLWDGSLPYHDEEVKALVWEVKYHKNPHALTLAGASLNEQLLAAAAEELGTPLLIPVPMHPGRKRKRGHNQAETLCETALFRVASGFHYTKHLLIRTRNTPQQQGLEKHVRLQNVKNSMEVTDPKQVAGRVCIVVDDVTTTGATFAEARRALLAAGARKVVPIALAHS